MSVVSPLLSTRTLAFALTLSGLALAASGAHAEVGGGTSWDVLCARQDGTDPRLIEIVSDGANRIPCETWYTKWGARALKASAANAEGHCEQVARQIQSNLESAGFTCGVAAVGGVAPDETLPQVSARPPTRDEATFAAPPQQSEERSAGSPTNVTPEAAAVAPVPRDAAVEIAAVDVAAVGSGLPAETVIVPIESTELTSARPPRQDAPMALPAHDEQRRVTPARLRAHVNAFMTERPGCSANLEGATYAADGSFAVVQWSCEIATSGYASHLLAIFADGTAPASLRIGGALARSSKVRTIDKDGRVQVQTKLYKSDDPKCCPSVVQVDVYRVDRSSYSSSIERLAN